MRNDPDLGQRGVDLSIPVFNLDALKKTEKAIKGAAVAAPRLNTMAELQLLNLQQEITEPPHRCSDNSFRDADLVAHRVELNVALAG